jgi:hypothetical protein
MSDYAKFRNVNKGYLKKEGLAIEVVLEENVKVGPADRVAVYQDKAGGLSKISVFQWVEKGKDDRTMFVNLEPHKLSHVKPSTVATPFKYCFVYEDHSGRVLAKSAPFYLCETEDELSALVPTGLASNGSSFDMLSFPEGTFDGEWPASGGDIVNSPLGCWSGSVISGPPHSDDSLGVVSLRTGEERRESLPVLEIHSREPSPRRPSISRDAEEIPEESTIVVQPTQVSLSAHVDSLEDASNLVSSQLLTSIECSEPCTSLHYQEPISVPQDDMVVIGFPSEIKQDDLVVTGSHSEFTQDDMVVSGSHSEFKQDDMVATGSHSEIKQDDMVVSSSHSEFQSQLAEVEPIDGKVDKTMSVLSSQQTSDLPSVVAASDLMEVVSVKELQKKDDEISRLKKQQKLLNTQLQALEEKLTRKDSELASTNSQVRKWQKVVAEMESALKDTKEECVELKTRVEKLDEDNSKLTHLLNRQKSKVLYLQEHTDKAIHDKRQADREAQLLAEKVEQYETERNLLPGNRRPSSAKAICETAEFENTSDRSDPEGQVLFNHHQQKHPAPPPASSSTKVTPTRRRSTACINGDSVNEETTSRTQVLKKNSSCDDLSSLHRNSNNIEKKLFHQTSQLSGDSLSDQEIANLAQSLEGQAAVCPHCKVHLLGYETEVIRQLHIESCLRKLLDRNRK